MILAAILPHTKLYGGVKRFLELGNMFVARGHRFVLYTPDAKAPDWFDFKGEMQPFDSIGEIRPDAIMTTTPRFVELMKKSGASRKIFYHVRKSEKLKPIVADPDVEIFSCSTNVCDYDLRKYKCKTFKAAGGVTLADYTPRTDYSRPETRPFTVMAYGRLAERVKGTKYVVKACERLYRKGLDIKLLLFDTPTSDKGRMKISNFVCSCPFEFVVGHPFHRNSELFGRADCFVSAENPAYSGWNNTVAEAMACGLPVVSTTAGTADMITDGATGIISARWVFCFEKHIRHLYGDERLRRRLGMAARERIASFDWARLADDIIAHLEGDRQIQAESK